LVPGSLAGLYFDAILNFGICYNLSMKIRKTKAEKRENKKREKMRVSGKSVFKIKEIIIEKAKRLPK
jgi:hypothetical protein